MVVTSTAPSDYDKGVYSTIPYYDEIHRAVLDLVGHVGFAPRRWLDSGCGTGTFVAQAAELWPEADFVLADPSEEMLTLAKEKHAGDARMRFVQTGSESLAEPDGAFDVITALLAHHYLHPEERAAALQNCRRMLRPGGVLAVCEHTAPRTERGRDIMLLRWRDYQAAHGKTIEKANAHVARYNKGYFPITAAQQLQLLESSGFSVCEILAASYCDVVFYAIK